MRIVLSDVSRRSDDQHMLLIPVLAFVSALFWFVVLGRPRFLPRDGQPQHVARLTIIIPARNEEDELGGLLASIEAQGIDVGQVIVVDDDSEDRTAEIAREHGALVLPAGDLPEGWKGKQWACQQGASVAQGDWLLFLDADTRIEAGGLARLMTLTNDPARVYSVCPWHRIGSAVEELSAFFNVMMVAGSGGFGARSRSGEALFGQCLLISAAHYRLVGGHASVRAELLENFQLANRLEVLGIERRCYLGRGAVHMRMFRAGFMQLWRSWQKGFTTGAGGAPRVALIGCSLWISGAMMALVGAVLALLPAFEIGFKVAAAVVYLTYVAQTFMALRLVGSFSVINALFFPVTLMFYQVLFFWALGRRALGKTTVWKGRDVG